jgi:hypothetical protein
LGVDRVPHQLIIQVEGHGFLIAVKTFLSILDQSLTLRALIMRYIHVFIVQTDYTALADGSRLIGERLARWLLMCHDRIEGDEIALTHEFLGIMLGVRRSASSWASGKVIRPTSDSVQSGKTRSFAFCCFDEASMLISIDRAVHYLQ